MATKPPSGYSKLSILKNRGKPTQNSTIVLIKIIIISALTWTRVGSLTRSKSKNKDVNRTAKHKDISQWLKDLDLEQYASLFHMYQGVEDILHLSEADLKDLGVKKSSHRAAIISSLTQLQAKYYGMLFAVKSVNNFNWNLMFRKL